MQIKREKLTTAPRHWTPERHATWSKKPAIRILWLQCSYTDSELSWVQKGLWTV